MSQSEDPRLSMQASVESIRDALTEVILRKGWLLEQLPDKLIWTTVMQGSQAQYRCYLQIDPDLGAFVFYCVLPATIPPESRVEAAVAVAAANYGLAVGKFELDLRDGELRFSTGIDVTGTRLDPIVAERMVMRAIELADAYGPRLSNPPPLPDVLRPGGPPQGAPS